MECSHLDAYILLYVFKSKSHFLFVVDICSCHHHSLTLLLNVGERYLFPISSRREFFRVTLLYPLFPSSQGRKSDLPDGWGLIQWLSMLNSAPVLYFGCHSPVCKEHSLLLHAVHLTGAGPCERRHVYGKTRLSMSGIIKATWLTDL